MKKPNRNYSKSRLVAEITGLSDLDGLIISLTNQYETAISRTPVTDFRAQKEIDKTYKELLAHLRKVKRYQEKYK